MNGRKRGLKPPSNVAVVSVAHYASVNGPRSPVLHLDITFAIVPASAPLLITEVAVLSV